jgi:ATP-dependent exoDNAse (exonuclease V) beta subunit
MSPPAVTAPPDWDAWLAGITAARLASERHAALSASGLEGTDPAVLFGSDQASDGDEAVDGGRFRTGDVAQDAPDQGGPDQDGPNQGRPDQDSADRGGPDEADDVTAAETAAVTAGRAKGARDLELPPWTKGRYGTAIGRAVHAVLQTADLSAGAPAEGTLAGAALQDAVAAQCLAEGVVEYADVVADLARSALSSPLVARAAARPHWRETWVASTLPDGTVLEGIVDLLYTEDDGSRVIVDYKTDAVPVAALPARATFYRPQIDAYARALRAATGSAVAGTLLFLHPAGPAVAVAVPVSDG